MLFASSALQPLPSASVILRHCPQLQVPQLWPASYRSVLRTRESHSPSQPVISIPSVNTACKTTENVQALLQYCSLNEIRNQNKLVHVGLAVVDSSRPNFLPKQSHMIQKIGWISELWPTKLHTVPTIRISCQWPIPIPQCRGKSGRLKMEKFLTLKSCDLD